MFVLIALLLAPQIVSLFIKNELTVNYGSNSLRIMCISMPLTALIFLANTMFQATKETKKALAITLLRKGIIDIPLMIWLNTLIPFYGVVLSQPLVDVISSFLSITLIVLFFKKSKKEQINNIENV